MQWLLIGVVLLAPVAAPAADPVAKVIFTGVTIVDVEVGKLVPDRTVVVTVPRITAVVAAEGFSAWRGASGGGSRGSRAARRATSASRSITPARSSGTSSSAASQRNNRREGTGG